jgi:hypothetical protein
MMLILMLVSLITAMEKEEEEKSIVCYVNARSKLGIILVISIT